MGLDFLFFFLFFCLSSALFLANRVNLLANQFDKAFQKAASKNIFSSSSSSWIDGVGGRYLSPFI